MRSRIPKRRLFYALWPDQAVRERIQVAPFPRLKATTTPQQNWHMTLVFLGPTTEPQQADFIDVAASIKLPSFTLSLDMTGQFKRAGVVWLGASVPPPGLLQLQHQLETGLRNVCPEHPAFAAAARPYCPHITLYRHIRKPLVAVRIKPVSWAVDSYSLIESRPSERPVYRELGRWSLASSPN